jgi:hypothetical protein
MHRGRKDDKMTTRERNSYDRFMRGASITVSVGAIALSVGGCRTATNTPKPADINGYYETIVSGRPNGPVVLEEKTVKDTSVPARPFDAYISVRAEKGKDCVPVVVIRLGTNMEGDIADSIQLSGEEVGGMNDEIEHAAESCVALPDNVKKEHYKTNPMN